MDEEDALTVLEKKIIDAFVVFDHASSNTVDVREVGTIIRSLGFYDHIQPNQCLPIIHPILNCLLYMKTTSIQNLRAHFAMTEMFKYYCKLITSSLGCCPSEAEIQEILVAAEDEETSGSVKLDRFLSTVSHIIQEKRLQPASPEKLLKAFLTLDRDRKGYLTKEFLSKIMMEEGEPFTQEELDEMMAAAIDGETGNILYEYYINQLMVNPTDDNLIPQPKVISRKEHSNH